MFGEIILLGVLLGKTATTGEIPLNKYQPHPAECMQTLMYQSENLRQMQGEIDRFWMSDQPSHLTADGNRLPPLPACTAPLGAALGGIASVLEAAQTVANTPDTTRRADTLMYQSDGSGIIQPANGGWFWDCWDRMNDKPSTLTSDRTHGGVR